MITQDGEALRAALVDCNRLYRAGLKLILESVNVKVIAEGDSLRALLAGPDDPYACDFLLMRLPRSAEAIDELRTAREAISSTKLVVVADRELNPDTMVKIIEAGADAVLLSDLAPDVFLQSLRLVRLGEKVLPAQLARMLICGDMGHSDIPHDLRQIGLSEREMEILRLLVQGDPNKLIALQLNIAEATVKVHVKAVLRKIRVTNRTQAAVWALKHGMTCETGV